MSIQAIRSNAALDQLAMAQSAGATAATSKAAQNSPQKVGGPPPAAGGGGGGGGVKPAAGGTSSTAAAASSTNTGKVYDEKDANKDGVVSLMEEMAYTLSQSAAETDAQPVVSTSQMQGGLNAYRQSQNPAGATSLNDISA